MASPAQANELIALEAMLLDERRWEAWLDLYAEDAVYWVPARTAAGDPTGDPQRELSLIYYDNRRSLRERIMRIESGRSLASTPLQRTVHIVGAAVSGAGEVFRVPFCVHLFEPRAKRSGAFFGHYEYRLSAAGGALRIQAKKILLANDHLELIADVYSL